MKIHIVAKYYDGRERNYEGVHAIFLKWRDAQDDMLLLNGEIQRAECYDPETDDLYQVVSVDVIE